MTGIYGVIGNRFDSEEDRPEKAINTAQYFKQIDQGFLGGNLLKKNLNDRFFKTDNDITVCFDGINFSNTQTASFFIQEYKKRGTSFLKSLKGNYSGFILDEKEELLHIFNDHLSTRNIYYFYQKKIGFIFSSKLSFISKILKSYNIPYSVDQDAVYMMALYGFILEDKTYIKGVKKLSYSTILSYSIKENTFTSSNWLEYSSKSKKVSLREAEENIDKLLLNSVKNNWNKDVGGKHLSLLSGGMDAKTNILLAKEIGFSNINTITFGQKDSKDIKYAKQIAEEEKFNHYERYLENPLYLIDDILENYIKPNDGMIMFHLSAHTSSTIRNRDLSGFSNLHTGQIGDVLFGSFSKGNYDFHKNKRSIGYTGFVENENFLDKIESLPEILNKYQKLGVELYIYEQRQINATIYGDRSLNDVIDNLSPFYDLDLIQYCLSLPLEVKRNQQIYFTWLARYHDTILNYKWDKINMKPNTAWKVRYGKLFKKYYNGGKKYFKLKYESMNPYQIWLNDYPSVLRTFDRILEAELEKPYLTKELKADLKSIYNNNIFEYRNKFAVITSLLAIKLHFDK